MDEQEAVREQRRVSMGRLRSSQTEEERRASNETAMLAMRDRRAYQSPQHQRARRNASSSDSNCTAFHYDSLVDYSAHSCIQIGPMNVACTFCGALKFAGETSGLCCFGGKVKLIQLPSPPEPLYSLLLGVTPESRHFLLNTQQYNTCFQMTSFGAEMVQENGFNPTFKVI